jgi:hypothetical protein
MCMMRKRRGKWVNLRVGGNGEKKSEKGRVHSILNGKEREVRSKEVDCINVEFSCGVCIHGEYYLYLLMGLNLFLSLSLQTSSEPKSVSQPLQKKAPKHRPFSVLPVFFDSRCHFCNILSPFVVRAHVSLSAFH